MPISEHSLLLAIVFTDAAIIILLVTTWLVSGIEPFLRTWLVGLFVSLIGTFVSAVFFMSPALWVGALSFAMLALGFGMNALASFEFRTGRLPLRQLGPVIALVVAATLAAMLSGRIGLSLIIWQSWAAVCGMTAAINYWSARREAPATLAVLAFLYVLLAIPYALSAGILIGDGDMFLPRPDNWADAASRLGALVNKLGSGAILLMLSNRRAGERRRAPLPAAHKDGDRSLA